MHRDESQGEVVAVSRKAGHGVDKPNQLVIRLVEGHGVEGDAHYGETVRHRSRVRQNPDQPNLRQVHLIHTELHEELAAQGFRLAPGQMGENVTTRGLDLLGLARGTRLRLGREAVVEVTGLRTADIPASTFEIPAGYTEVEMPFAQLAAMGDSLAAARRASGADTVAQPSAGDAAKKAAAEGAKAGVTGRLRGLIRKP